MKGLGLFFLLATLAALPFVEPQYNEYENSTILLTPRPSNVNNTQSEGYTAKSEVTTGLEGYTTVPEMTITVPVAHQDLMPIFEPWCSQFSNTSSCPKGGGEVCGTNGITYSSHCLLCAACIPGLKISKMEVC